MENQILYEFTRNQNETVYLTLREYKQRKYIDLRVFFRSEDGGEMHPTKKGITLQLELLPELKKGIAICEKKISAPTS